MAEVRIIVEGQVGTGKSALLGEIEILLKALGIPHRYLNPEAAQSEKHLTGADWTSELEQTEPEVVLIERLNVPGKKEMVLDVDQDVTTESFNMLFRFFQQVADKFTAAERKHGWGDFWNKPECKEEWLRREFFEHIRKGDPKDVAIYCAIMIARGWATSDLPRNLGEADKLLYEVVNQNSVTGRWRISLSGGTLLPQMFENKQDAIDYWQTLGRADGLNDYSPGYAGS